MGCGVGDEFTAECMGASSDPSAALRLRACLAARLDSLCLAHEGGWVMGTPLLSPEPASIA